MITYYDMEALRKQIKRQVHHECSGYNNGNCCLLELREGGDEHSPCVQENAYSLCCNYFEQNVLPLNEELFAELYHGESAIRCELCGKAYIPSGTNIKYCSSCRDVMRKQQNREAQRRHREKKGKGAANGRE